MFALGGSTVTELKAIETITTIQLQKQQSLTRIFQIHYAIGSYSTDHLMFIVSSSQSSMAVTTGGI